MAMTTKVRGCETDHGGFLQAKVASYAGRAGITSRIASVPQWEPPAYKCYPLWGGSMSGTLLFIWILSGEKATATAADVKSPTPPTDEACHAGVIGFPIFSVGHAGHCRVPLFFGIALR